MRDMPAPEGYRRMPVPPDKGNRLSAYDHGVRFEQDCSDPDDKKKMKWACACFATCRAASMKGEGAIFHSKTNTGNITRRVSSVHGESSLGRAAKACSIPNRG